VGIQDTTFLTELGRIRSYTVFRSDIMSKIELQPEELLSMAGSLMSQSVEIRKVAREMQAMFQDGVNPELRNQLKGQFETITVRLQSVGNSFESLGMRTREVARSLKRLDQDLTAAAHASDTAPTMKKHLEEDDITPEYGMALPMHKELHGSVAETPAARAGTLPGGSL
jgi:hypothetical protein